MRRVVVDTSALAAIVFNESESARVEPRLHGAIVCAPTLMPYELANVARTRARRRPEESRQILQALADALDPARGIVLYPVDVSDAALVATTTGLSVYDASYLVLAGTLGADLVTLDERLASALAG